MTTQTIKQRLFEYIRDAKDSEVKKMYSDIENGIQYNKNIWDDEEAFEGIEKRSTELKSGKVKGISWTEVKNNLKKEK